FFQAEDGIRDFHVTGVQTCALPISDDVPANRLAEDLAVEGGDTLHIAGRDTENLADGIGGAVRHPAASLLNNLQRLDGGRPRVLVVVHFLFDGGAFGIAENETISLDKVAHDQRSTSAITKSILPR